MAKYITSATNLRCAKARDPGISDAVEMRYRTGIVMAVAFLFGVFLWRGNGADSECFT